MTSRHRRLAALEGVMHHHINRDELGRSASAIAAEEGVDADEVVADVLALAQRTAGMSVTTLADYLAAEEGIPVDQVLTEAATLT
jgi:hypothetical protein